MLYQALDTPFSGCLVPAVQVPGCGDPHMPTFRIMLSGPGRGALADFYEPASSLVK